MACEIALLVNINMELSQQNEPSRYAFIDALRGLAALGVMLHHVRFASKMSAVYTKHGSEALDAILAFGAYGVPVFFILSGFVIAHSLRENSLSLKAVGNFMLRRQLRLDPAYWVALLLMLAVTVLRAKLLKLPSGPITDWQSVLINLAYLQGVLSLPANQHILGVAWTLCIEVQFYLFFLILLMLGRGDKPLNANSNLTSLSACLLIVSGLACLLLKQFYQNVAWFFSHWHYFALGALAYYAWKKVLPAFYFTGYSALFFVIALSSPAFAPSKNFTYTAMLTGLAAAWILYVAGVSHQMGHWGSDKVFQYLGKISYSLYLTHIFVISIVLKGAIGLVGNNALLAYVMFVVTVVGCIGFAHLFYLAIERPSLKLAEKFKEAKPERPGASIEAPPIADGSATLAADS